MSENTSTVQDFPTSYMQQANLLWYKLNPKYLADNISTAIWIKSSMITQILQNTLRALTKRHQFLYSIYCNKSEKIIQ